MTALVPLFFALATGRDAVAGGALVGMLASLALVAMDSRKRRFSK